MLKNLLLLFLICLSSGIAKENQLYEVKYLGYSEDCKDCGYHTRKYSIADKLKNTKSEMLLKVSGWLPKITEDYESNEIHYVFGDKLIVMVWQSRDAHCRIYIYDIKKNAILDQIYAMNPSWRENSNYIIFRTVEASYTPSEYWNSVMYLYDLNKTPKDNRRPNLSDFVYSERYNPGGTEAGLPIYPEFSYQTQSEQTGLNSKPFQLYSSIIRLNSNSALFLIRKISGIESVFEIVLCEIENSVYVKKINNPENIKFDFMEKDKTVYSYSIKRDKNKYVISALDFEDKEYSRFIAFFKESAESKYLIK